MATDDDDRDEIVLPTSAEKVNHALIEEAVGEIHGIVGKTLKKGMEEVGAYLLRHFYDDDTVLAFSLAPNKHLSMKRLFARCDTLELPVGEAFLRRSIHMAAMLKSLPKEASFRELPPSHRVELLPLRDPERAEELASKAIARGMSVVKLREAVHRAREANASESTRARTPAALLALRRFVKQLRDEETGRLALKKSDVEALDDEQLEMARAELRVAEKRIAEMKRLLGE